MNKLKTYFIQLNALALAVFVAMLSMGFTYNWEVCSHAEVVPTCNVVEESTSCCCTTQIDVPQCACGDMSHNTCDISFSKYVHFDFEVLTSEYLELNDYTALDYTISKIDFASFVEWTTPHRIYEHSLPPPKSGRDRLCLHQTFLI